jgi:hypothetical protein
MKEFVTIPEDMAKVRSLGGLLDLFSSFVPEDCNVSIYIEKGMVTVDLTDENEDPIFIDSEKHGSLMGAIIAAQDYVRLAK